MDKQIFKDRILETENLTDELEDAEANWLINWGIGQLSPILADVSDEETAGEKANALMAAMRKINRICGGRQTKSTDDLSSDLEKLSGLFGSVFNTAQQVNSNECKFAAKRLANMGTTLQVLEFLTRWGRRRLFRI